MKPNEPELCSASATMAASRGGGVPRAADGLLEVPGHDSLRVEAQHPDGHPGKRIADRADVGDRADEAAPVAGRTAQRGRHDFVLVSGLLPQQARAAAARALLPL